jgi:peptidoglycan/LPS O-acetylase OafA/YrhL
VSQKKSFSTETIDRIGVITSTTCVVHCLLAPVLISYLAVYAHFIPSEENTHRTLAVGVTTLGVIAIGFGYRKHGRASVLALTALGLAIILAGAFAGDRLPNHWCEVLVTLTGSSCMVLAHRQNHTFCRDCDQCKDKAFDEERLPAESLVTAREES